MKNNTSEIKNWLFTLQPDIFKIISIYQSGQNKGHGCNISTWCNTIYLFINKSINAIIYAFIYLCTCVKEKKKEKIH